MKKIKTALQLIIPYIEKSNLPTDNSDYGKKHLLSMIDKMMSGEVSSYKAHRWLGYIQGCLCASNSATVAEMRAVNK